MNSRKGSWLRWASSVLTVSHACPIARTAEAGIPLQERPEPTVPVSKEMIVVATARLYDRNIQKSAAVLTFTTSSGATNRRV
jgi:hypothetical protein